MERWGRGSGGGVGSAVASTPPDPILSGHTAEHGGSVVCASKRTGADLKVPIGGPVPLPGGKGQTSPSSEVPPMAAIAPPAPTGAQQPRIGLSSICFGLNPIIAGHRLCFIWEMLCEKGSSTHSPDQ